MKKVLYDKEVTCPVCKNIFHTKKVRSSAIRIKKRDSDFCVYYEDVNPILYSVFVCPNCGYAALENIFKEIDEKGIKIIKENVSSKWIQRDMGKKRTFEEGIEVYKLALLCGQLLGKKKGLLGILCLRLAWLYRYLHREEEYIFLRYTINCFEEAFRYESFPIGNLDEISVLYLLGELNRRLENYSESINWFNQAVHNPAIKSKRKLEMQAREQWMLAKEQYKKIKKNQEVG